MRQPAAKRGSVLTPAEALALLAEQHTPYLPRVVSVSDGWGEWREATIEDQAESIEWWCDGCNRPAEKCRAAPILALAEVRLEKY